MLKKIHKCDLILLIITFIFTLGVYFFHSQVYSPVAIQNSSSLSYSKAKVLRVIDDQSKKDETTNRYYGVQSLYVEILDGSYKNKKVYIDNYLSTTHNVRLKNGETFIACIDNPESDNTLITAYNYYRTPYIYGFVGLLLIIILMIGKSKGMRTIISLAFTLYAIVDLLLPMIFSGFSPIISTIFIVILTTGYSLFMLNGASIKTWVAVIATSLGVIISGLSFLVLSQLIHISGFNTDQAEALIIISQQTGLKINEVLFSGILISGLGAVMDVAMSISSTIEEISHQNPELGVKGLFFSGMRVGKDMMGTMSNTLILAFAGGSLNTLVFIFAYNYSYHQIINMYSIGIELMQGISASMGVILTVPFTSLAGAFFISGKVLKK